MCNLPESRDSQLGTNWRALKSRLKQTPGEEKGLDNNLSWKTFVQAFWKYIQKVVQLLETAPKCKLKYIIFFVIVPKGRLRQNVGNGYSVLCVFVWSTLALSYDTKIQDTFRYISYNNYDCKHVCVLAKRVVTSSNGHAIQLCTSRYN